MEEKLRRLMKHEGINSTRLAEMLGIQASGISHIMSGRNKPSFDFLVKLLDKFPQINPDWLISDKGPMYRDEVKKAAAQPAAAAVPTPSETVRNMASAQTGQNGGLFGDTAPQASYIQPAITPPATVSALDRDDEDIIPSDTARNPAVQLSRGFTPSSQIERIVVFYKDKTFSEYQPE